MTFNTADICDADADAARVCDTELGNFGRRRTFWGQAVTLRCVGDHRAGVRLCMQPGHGKVLVIDGGGSRDIALFGGTMASIAVRNGWAGAIVFGAIRDVEEIGICDLGVKALYTTPRSARIPAAHERDVVVQFGNVTFNPGDWVYADADGVLVRSTEYKSAPIVLPADY